MFINEEISYCFSQNKRIYLTEKTFPVPYAVKFDLNWEKYHKTKTSFLITRKPFLAEKHFLLKEKRSYSESIFLNQDTVCYREDEKIFRS